MSIGGLWDSVTASLGSAFGEVATEGMSEWLGIESSDEKATVTANPTVHRQGSNAVNADGSNLEQSYQRNRLQESSFLNNKYMMIGGGVLAVVALVVLIKVLK